MAINDKPPTAQELKELEGRYTFNRIVELQLDPARGKFDATHLKEINRRIFQDLPGLGFSDVTPGQFRPPVAPGNDWIKHRKLKSVDVVSSVAYSPMDKAAQARLDKTLKDIDPSKLAKLKTAEFTQALGKLYTELDYIHPFSDGNSRTLRVFTKQLAEESGYELDWNRFFKNAAGRDVLYIARDISVNELAFPHIRHDTTKRDVMFSTDQLGNNRNLPNLLCDAIRPIRAIAFEQLPEVEAIRKHPDLGEAFKVLSTAVQYFETKIPDKPITQQEALLAVKNHIQVRLDEGEIRNFHPASKKQQKGHTSIKSAVDKQNCEISGHLDKDIGRDR